jgi:hypothetical protein
MSDEKIPKVTRSFALQSEDRMNVLLRVERIAGDPTVIIEQASDVLYLTLGEARALLTLLPGLIEDIEAA